MKYLFISLATVSLLHAQGPLSPPGAPAPTQKSLQELWDKMEELQMRSDTTTFKLDLMQQQNGVLMGNISTLQEQNQRLSQRLISLGESAGTLASPWRITTVSHSGRGGYSGGSGLSAMALAPDGNPAMVYTYQNGPGTWQFIYSEYNGTSWIESVMPGQAPLSPVALGFSPTGQPSVLYQPFTTPKQLTLATKNVGTWSFETAYTSLGTTGTLGNSDTVLFTPGGQPVAAVNHVVDYLDHARIKYLVKSSGVWNQTTVDEENPASAWKLAEPSLTVSPAGLPAMLITSYNIESHAVKFKYATLLSGLWTISDITTGYQANVYTSGIIADHSQLKFTPEGQPAFCFVDRNHILNYCVLNGSSWKISPIVGGYPRKISLAFSATGQPAVSYVLDGERHELKYATFRNSAWEISTVDSSAFAVGPPTLVFSSGSQPRIGYLISIDSEGRYEIRYAFSAIETP